MAEPVSAIMQAMLLRTIVAFAAIAGAGAAIAEPLADPTRPPLMRETASAERGATGLILQSVLIAPGRSEAIISGRTVRLGEKFGDARLVRIAESEVTLRNGSEVQTLKLFPDIEKRPVEKRLTQSRADAKPRHRDEEK